MGEVLRADTHPYHDGSDLASGIVRMASRKQARHRPRPSAHAGAGWTKGSTRIVRCRGLAGGELILLLLLLLPVVLHWAWGRKVRRVFFINVATRSSFGVQAAAAIEMFDGADLDGWEIIVRLDNKKS